MTEYDYTLAKGAGTGEALCAMQRAALLHAQRFGYIDQIDSAEIVTDRPCWANRAVTGGIIAVNDRLDWDERQRLRPIVERALLTCTRVADEVVEKRINVRVAVWAARSVSSGSPESLAAVEAAEGWLAGSTSAGDAAAADAAAEAYAAYAAYAAAGDAAAAADAADRDLVEWASDLIDAWEKAAAEEGHLGDESWRQIVATKLGVTPAYL